MGVFITSERKELSRTMCSELLEGRAHSCISCSFIHRLQSSPWWIHCGAQSLYLNTEGQASKIWHRGAASDPPLSYSTQGPALNYCPPRQWPSYTVHRCTHCTEKMSCSNLEQARIGERLCLGPTEGNPEPSWREQRVQPWCLWKLLWVSSIREQAQEKSL